MVRATAPGVKTGRRWPVPRDETRRRRIWEPYTCSVALIPEFFPAIEGFEWDEGNASKSWSRHEINQTEAEQVFLNRPVVIIGDAAHSRTEARYFSFGRTDAGRLLTVVFTVRERRIRVISARPMSRKERREYGEATRS